MQRGPPLPIPNREVKPFSADDTAFWWESRSLPAFINPNPVIIGFGFFFATDTSMNAWYIKVHSVENYRCLNPSQLQTAIWVNDFDYKQGRYVYTNVSDHIN